MNKSLTILTELDYESSRSLVEANEKLLKKIDSHHKGAIQQYQEYLAVRKPVEDRIKSIKAKQKVWLTSQHKQQKSLLSDIQTQFLADRNKLLEQQASNLREQGNESQAQAIEQVIQNNESSLQVSVAKQSDTMTRWGYEIVDETKLKPEFVTVTISPKRKDILAMVTKHHEHAESIVGAGAIKVTQTVVPVYRKPKNE